MPFNKLTAASAGRKGGLKRKPLGEVRNTQLKLSITPAEYQLISDKAIEYKLSKTETVILAITRL